ncbi:O-antigen ligase family protein [Anaeromicrobium sediminis]|uniref:O-antigen ligase-related domain-containing protein n=1 Tax=Anaeromicrobium sediminis TaxID=1478221 RepID=A0A267MFF7_9FIRM|nr:O-antigen ligase family protein [Anaeromicrobium sediminis]PAB58276.1 hypothetical protein CCE28_15890 [Anaeromicrobium sediminis]
MEHISSNDRFVKPKRLYYVLLSVVFFTPFFRGLFFQKELLPVQLIIGLLGMVFLLSNGKETVKFSIVELGLSCVVISYIIATLFSVNLNLSIQETLKYITYLLVLIMAKNHINTYKRVKDLIRFLVGSGVVVAIIGIGAMFSLWSYQGAYEGKMLSSTFQYHNAFGIYTLAILFLSYGGISVSYKIEKYAFQISSFLLFLGLILSYSRGAWVFLPLCGFIYYILIGKDAKINFISAFLGNAIGTVIILKKVTQFAEEGNAMGMLWVVVGAVVSFGVYIGIYKILRKLNLNKKIYNYVIPGLGLISPIVLLSSKSLLAKILPKTLANRIMTISFTTNTVTERTVFYEDAFKIIKEYPIVGTGGGGWSTLYHSYKTYAYTSTQVHNYYMQLWVEIGTLGIVLFALTLMGFLYMSYKIYRKSNEGDRIILSSLFIAIVCILGHSFIDFDMSLSAIPIIMWLLIGSLISFYKKDINTSAKGIYLGFTAVFIIVSGMNYISYNATKNAATYVGSGKIEKAIRSFDMACTSSPFDGNKKVDYANLLNIVGKNKKDKSMIGESIKIMEKGLSLSKHDNGALLKGAKFYFKNGEMEKGIELIRELVETHPLDNRAYEDKARGLLLASEIYEKNGEVDKARDILKEVAQIEEVINKKNEDIKNNVVMTNKVKFIEITDKTKVAIEEAKNKLD